MNFFEFEKRYLIIYEFYDLDYFKIMKKIQILIYKIYSIEHSKI